MRQRRPLQEPTRVRPRGARCGSLGSLRAWFGVEWSRSIKTVPLGFARSVKPRMRRQPRVRRNRGLVNRGFERQQRQEVQTCLHWTSVLPGSL